MSQKNETRYIPRHSLQTRLTHGTVAISCIWLMISGLFVFIPGLAAAAPAEVTQAMRVSHRIVGGIFIVVPIVSALIAPRGFRAFLEKYFTKWTKEDKIWMARFVPYMLGPKRVHMPDQDEVKSGQRVADGAMIVGGILMALSGLGLWLGTSVIHVGPEAELALRMIHDVFFLIMIIMVAAHVYLGAGIFQPYRGTIRLMWGDGRVSESNGLYHWGFWARKEIEKGNVVSEQEIK